MDPFLMLLAVVTALGVMWYIRNRKRSEPPEDEWVLPPEDGAPSAFVPPTEAPQVLDRDSLLQRDRTLDPSKWDNTPDGLVGTDPVSPGAESAPPAREFLDRSLLEKRGNPSGELGEWDDE